MSFTVTNDEGGLVIFCGDRTWYNSRETPMKNQKVSAVGKVRASAKSKRVVESILFEKMMEAEEDPYWKSLFDEAATGKFPRNFKFQNGILNYKIRSKTDEQPLPEDNIEECISLVKKFFLDKAGLLSPEDRRRKKIEEEKRISEMIMNEVVSWSQIRSEKQRMIMLSLYVETIGVKHGLNVEERRGLVQNIRIGILAGYFGADNIKILGNRITNIEGLEFNESTGEFEINKEICKITRSYKSKTEDYTEDMTLESMESSGGYEEDSLDRELNSLQSSKSSKKKWNKFLSEISKKS